MAQNVFKIYDGRTSFWQWDRQQKLIILDEAITEVHFANKNMTHAVKRDVYIDEDGVRVCNVPDDLLKLPNSLIAYAYSEGATVRSVTFAVNKRPVPDNYIAKQTEDLTEKLTQLSLKINAIADTQADDMYYDNESNSIQLVANGELIGNRVVLPNYESSIISECKINEDGYLIVVFADGATINAGYVGGNDGATFTPHISEDKILYWTCDQDLQVPDPIDLNMFDEWSTLPEEDIGAE